MVLKETDAVSESQLIDLYQFIVQSPKEVIFYLIQEAIENVLWNETHGAWFDYNIIQGSQRVEKDNFYPSNIAPLWAECYP